MRPARACVCLALACAASAGQAAEPEDDQGSSSALTLHGFGTLGVARSDDDHVEYVRDLSQPFGIRSRWSAKIDSVLGVQAGYAFDDRVEADLQVVSRYHGEGNFAPEVSWAYLRYNPDPATTLRFGRLGTEFYMLADSRLVGYANLTVRPPPDFYGPLVFSYLDGVDAAKAVPVGSVLLRGKLFAGRSPERAYLGDGLYWDMSGSLLVGGHLDLVTGPWQVRVGQTRVRFDQSAPIDTYLFNKYGVPDLFQHVPEMSGADTWTRYDSVGVVYDRSPFQCQVMLSRIDQGSAGFEDSRSGYAIASYRTGQVTPYVGYSWTRSTAASFSSALTFPYNLFAPALSAATHSDQHTWTLGARWDVANNVAVKAQADWVRGSAASVFPFREERPGWDGDMAVYSLALDFVF